MRTDHPNPDALAFVFGLAFMYFKRTQNARLVIMFLSIGVNEMARPCLAISFLINNFGVF